MKIDPKHEDSEELYKLITSTVVPRPIAWVSTIGDNGVYNLAPFSVYGILGYNPPIVYISIGSKGKGQKKDTLLNIEYSKDFVINVVSESMAQAMNQSSANFPRDVSEFKEVGVTPIKADLVKSPMVRESPVNMECILSNIMEFGQLPRKNSVVIGEVVQIHIKDELYIDGNIQFARLKPLGRLSGNLYCHTTDIFEIKRPSLP